MLHGFLARPSHFLKSQLVAWQPHILAFSWASFFSRFQSLYNAKLTVSWLYIHVYGTVALQESELAYFPQ